MVDFITSNQNGMLIFNSSKSLSLSGQLNVKPKHKIWETHSSGCLGKEGPVTKKKKLKTKKRFSSANQENAEGIQGFLFITRQSKQCKICIYLLDNSFDQSKWSEWLGWSVWLGWFEWLGWSLVRVVDDHWSWRWTVYKSKWQTGLLVMWSDVVWCGLV